MAPPQKPSFLASLHSGVTSEDPIASVNPFRAASSLPSLSSNLLAYLEKLLRLRPFTASSYDSKNFSPFFFKSIISDLMSSANVISLSIKTLGAPRPGELSVFSVLAMSVNSDNNSSAVTSSNKPSSY